MNKLVPWIERQFEFDQSVDAFPSVLERLSGTAARATEFVKDLPEDVLSIRVEGKCLI